MTSFSKAVKSTFMQRLLGRDQPSQEEVDETLERLEKEGLVEWVGIEHGHKKYRITDKGSARLKQLETSEAG